MSASDIKIGPDGLPVMCPSQMEVFDALLRLHANRQEDATDREIQELVERLKPGYRIDPGTVSARIKDMIKLGFVLESPSARISRAQRGRRGAMVRATYVPHGLRGGAVARPGAAGICPDIGTAGGSEVDCY